MPTTTTGVATSFIDFTRASNATVTDSDGLVKWAPHNLLTNSESFDAASWAKSSVTPTANSIAAPNGTTTADTLAASGANGTTLQTFTAEAISYTFAVWLKRKTGTGNIQIAADSGTYTTVTITSDWALYTVTQTPAAGSKSAGIRIVTSADEVYAWGASLYRSDLAMQPNTSAYPLYNPTTVKNLLGYTQDFSNAAWTKGNLVTTGMANVTATTDPLGLYTADKLQETATTAEHYILQSITASAAPYTFSVYLKAAERTWATLQFSSGGLEATWFNLASDGTGVPGTVASGCTAASTYVGNGWYRCSVTRTATAATWYAVANPSLGNGISPIYAGTLNSGIYLWGAQLSDSASLDSYVPVYGAAVTSAAYYGPRRDFDGATLACKGLLVEEQRANLITYSSEFDNAAWGKANLNTTGTPAWVNVQTAPDGNLSADKLIESNTTAQHYIVGSTTVTSGATYSLSVYLRAGERTFAWIEFYGGIPAGTVYINLSTGAKGTTTGSASAVTVTDVGGGWWRVVLPGFVASSTTPTFAVYTSTGNGVNSYAGDGTSGIYIWGAQIELGSFATSYIPTGSASATRNADVASVSTQAFPYSATESTLVASVSALAVYTGGILRLGPSAGNNGLRLYQNNSTFRAYVDTGSFVSIGTATPNTVQKMALAYNGATNGAVLDGGTVSSVGTTVAAVAEKLEIGGLSNSSDYFCGHIRQVTYIPRRLTNAELQTRTS